MSAGNLQHVILSCSYKCSVLTEPLLLHEMRTSFIIWVEKKSAFVIYFLLSLLRDVCSDYDVLKSALFLSHMRTSINRQKVGHWDLHAAWNWVRGKKLPVTTAHRVKFLLVKKEIRPHVVNHVCTLPLKLSSVIKKIRIRFAFLRFRIRCMHFDRKGWGIRKTATRMRTFSPLLW